MALWADSIENTPFTYLNTIESLSISNTTRPHDEPQTGNSFFCNSRGLRVRLDFRFWSRRSRSQISFCFSLCVDLFPISVDTDNDPDKQGDVPWK
jgi:hypothetical protein